VAIYHYSGRPGPIFLAAIANVALVWALLAALLLLARKPGRFQVAVWSGLILMLPWVLLKQGNLAGEWSVRHWLSLCLFTIPLATWIATVCLWRPSFYPVFNRLREPAEIIVGFTSLSAMVFVGQLLFCDWQSRGLNRPRPLRAQTSPAAAGLAAKPRVIWLLLDELSYQQVYETRFPGLDLPAFDRLAQQSTVFTHVVPAGLHTGDVLPSLLTGIPDDEVRASADGSHLRLHVPATHQWRPFDPHQTIFADADTAGYRTGVAGWFNPYCRILPGMLDRCTWVSRIQAFGAMEELEPNAPDSAYLFASWRDSLRWLLNRVGKHSEVYAQNDPAHLADYRDLLAAGDGLLNDSSIDFVFLHIPLPHPTGIYDRRTKKFGTAGTSYIDNLALTDLYLDHVYQLLKQRGEWDSATVIVMGDHSWRTSMFWASLPTWTAEDQLASHGGKFDSRPGYIVKLPYQNQPAHIDVPFPATSTRALIQQLVGGRITSSAQLADFAASVSQK